MGQGWACRTLKRYLHPASEHPLALAIVAAADAKGIAIPQVSEFDSPPARGRSAWSMGSGITLGNARFLGEKGMDRELARERGTLAPCPSPEDLPEDDGHGPRHRQGLASPQGKWWLSSFAGYEPADGTPAGDIRLITPPAIVAILRAGYRPG